MGWIVICSHLIVCLFFEKVKSSLGITENIVLIRDAARQTDYAAFRLGYGADIPEILPVGKDLREAEDLRELLWEKSLLGRRALWKFPEP